MGGGAEGDETHPIRRMGVRTVYSRWPRTQGWPHGKRGIEMDPMGLVPWLEDVFLNYCSVMPSNPRNARACSHYGGQPHVTVAPDRSRPFSMPPFP